MKNFETCPGQCGKSINVGEAHACANPIAYAVQSIADLVTIQGIGIDMADVRTVIHGGGRAVFASAEASGVDRVRLACDEVIANLKAAIVANAIR